MEGKMERRGEIPRLFRLEEDKNACIADKGEWIDGSWTWTWKWRRSPFGREMGEFEDLLTRIAETTPVIDKEDKIEWSLDDSKEYTVKRMREILDNLEINTGGVTKETRWTKIVPKKVCIFIWRVRLSRILCRVILDKMGIDLHSLLCPRCGDVVETIDHALVTCPEVKNLWRFVGRWWKRDLDGANSIDDVLQGSNSSIEIEKEDAIWSGMKWMFMYLNWSHRNSIVFAAERGKLTDKLFEMQRKSFEWISRRSKNWAMSWEDWLVNPTKVQDRTRERT